MSPRKYNWQKSPFTICVKCFCKLLNLRCTAFKALRLQLRHQHQSIFSWSKPHAYCASRSAFSSGLIWRACKTAVIRFLRRLFNYCLSAAWHTAFVIIITRAREKRRRAETHFNGFCNIRALCRGAFHLHCSCILHREVHVILLLVCTRRRHAPSARSLARPC